MKSQASEKEIGDRRRGPTGVRLAFSFLGGRVERRLLRAVLFDSGIGCRFLEGFGGVTL